MLVSFVIAALILLFIPSRKRIEPRPAIFNLVALVSGYGILVKFRPWLAAFMNPLLATAISVVLMLSLAFAFLKLLRPRRQG